MSVLAFKKQEHSFLFNAVLHYTPSFSITQLPASNILLPVSSIRTSGKYLKVSDTLDFKIPASGVTIDNNC